MDSLRKSVCRGLLEQTLQPIFLRTISAKDHLTLTAVLRQQIVSECGKSINEGEENFVGDSEIIALGGASNETKDRPLG